MLYERPGELVAQFKFTALLLPSGTHRITGLPFDKSQCKTERTIKDPELNVNIDLMSFLITYSVPAIFQNILVNSLF